MHRIQRHGTTLGGAVACLLICAAAQGGNAYVHDDGTAETAIGNLASPGVEQVWINSFDVLAGFETITSISTAWGSPGQLEPATVAGLPYRVWLFSDDAFGGIGDGDPNGPDSTLLTMATGSVDGAAITNDVLQELPITPTTVTTQKFFVAISITVPSGHFPAPVDTSQSSSGRSWVGAEPGQFMGDLGGANVIGWSDVDAIVGAGVLRVQANGIPGPASLALLGLAALAGRRRRR